MIVYLDTSTVLRVLLAQQPVLAEWGRWERAYTSELTGVEARRVIDRLRLDGALDDDGVVVAQEQLARLEAGIGRINLTRVVLLRASLPMATAVRTLDALHLASALLFQERRATPLTFATHDVQQATAARALGFRCVGV
ncbi:MAG: type II toxin-antitoxin system VapC family toxin [Alphaproteobacteria bacterium]